MEREDAACAFCEALLGNQNLLQDSVSYHPQTLKWRGLVGHFRFGTFSISLEELEGCPEGRVQQSTLPISYSSFVYTVGHEPLVGCEINLVVYSQHWEKEDKGFGMTKSTKNASPASQQANYRSVCALTCAYIIVPGTCMYVRMFLF